MYLQAWKFLLVSLVPNVGTVAARIWAGIVGYREYSEFMNRNTPLEVDQKKRTGFGCMIAYIATIFIFLILFSLYWYYLLRLGTPYGAL